MVKWFLKEHWMLAAAAILAVASMAFVFPDEQYLSYFDWDTLGCLFCVLAVANAFRRIGTFDRIARMAVAHDRSPRLLSLAIIAVTALFSMAFTNDVALIMMLPLSATMLVRLGEVRLLPTVYALQALAANLCGMVTPFGNPQTLYIYTRYQLGLGEFLGALAIPFSVSAVGILAMTLAMTRSKPANAGHDGDSGDSAKLQMPLDSRRLTLYGVLFAVTLLAVFRAIPFWMGVIVVIAGIAVADRKALAEVDYALLGTFACFFVFAGNVARIPSVEGFLSPLMSDWGLMASALTSQVISNVPTAVILSHFTEAWSPLLVGVNIGGAGTFVGSLASLIVIRYFGLSRKVFAQLRAPDAPTTRGFLVRFGLMNAASFIALLVICQLTMG